MRQVMIALGFLLSCTLFAQVAPDKYFIEFTDKNGTPYSVNDPSQFLTQRAIDRRVRQGIAVTEEDLPVNPAYVSAVSNIGVTVLTRSKWFNGITIYCHDTALLNEISALPFVKKIIKHNIPGSYNAGQNRKFARADKKDIRREGAASAKSSEGLAYNYGPSYNQIHMLKGDLVHNLGYRGQGMVIAVLDAGFLHADSLQVFDSLRAGGQILGTKDFVIPHNDVYHEYSHGTIVLSVMGGNLPGILIGTAPKASYWLLRSEDVNSENLIEEYNWVSAAEFADSVGADVINTSLGYTTFDDSTKSHTCADMTGNTTPVTRGANIAAGKGMVVSCSAGNLGGTSWTCLAAPSDGYRVICVAAVDSFGQHAIFSCTGFINDTLVKPSVAAQGVKTYASGTEDNTFLYFSGTSLSSPLIAGMSACLWQSHPDAGWKRIIQVMEESASHYNAPDTLTGYGIPDFSQAVTLLGVPKTENQKFHVFPNPFTEEFTLEIENPENGKAEISIFDILGNQVYHSTYFTGTGEGEIRVTGLSHLKPGMYLVRYSTGAFARYIPMIKTAD